MTFNDWVVRYHTRYFQVARQRGQVPARRTVLVREAAPGALEMRYRGRRMRRARDSGAAPEARGKAYGR